MLRKSPWLMNGNEVSPDKMDELTIMVNLDRQRETRPSISQSQIEARQSNLVLDHKSSNRS